MRSLSSACSIWSWERDNRLMCALSYLYSLQHKGCSCKKKSSSISTARKGLVSADQCSQCASNPCTYFSGVTFVYVYHLCLPFVFTICAYNLCLHLCYLTICAYHLCYQLSLPFVLTICPTICAYRLCLPHSLFGKPVPDSSGCF